LKNYASKIPTLPAYCSYPMNHPGKRPSSFNTASANTGEGCPKISGTPAPNSSLKDVLNGDIILSRKSSVELRRLIALLVAEVKRLKTEK